MRKLPGTDLEVFPLGLGGNVFGWTADETQSLAVLDAYADAGGNFVDTADVYSAWAEGHRGGESEEILGRWLARRGRRDDVVIATKVGAMPSRRGLRAETIRAAAEDSLRRLQTDHIDLYYAHYDDQDTPIEESLRAFDALVREGKVRYVAASNFTAPRLTEALQTADREGLVGYVALQPKYNLLDRRDFETTMAPVCEAHDLACVPYYGLARGFLTGKYRDGSTVDSPRAEGARAYHDERGERVLTALDEVAASYDVTVAAVALAWVAAQPTVAATIASARSPEQLADLLPMAELRLSDGDLARLDVASRQEVG
jgi:aryl-alcohol dehydrogenase-like predicted oxidoreductase